MALHPNLSPTTATLNADVFGPLAERARGRTFHPLHVGDTYRDPPAIFQEALRDAAHRPHVHSYTSVQGEASLLASVTRWMSARLETEVAPDAIQIVNGATAGLSIVAETLLDPGDDVLLPAPYWPLIRGIFAGRGVRPIEVPMFDRLRDPSFDLDRALETHRTDRTVALYINTPHNPTGRVLPPDMLDVMARFAKRHGLWVIADEAYEDLWFSGEPPRSIWLHPDLRGRVVVAHTMSKGYAMAGARIGWIHGAPDVVRVIHGVTTFHSYCTARAVQVAAAATLGRAREWQDGLRGEYGASGARAARALDIDPPEGGTFLFFDASRYLSDEDEDALPFLTRAMESGVMLTPGRACGAAYAKWARLCFTAAAPTDLDDALHKLRRVANP